MEIATLKKYPIRTNKNPKHYPNNKDFPGNHLLDTCRELTDIWNLSSDLLPTDMD